MDFADTGARAAAELGVAVAAIDPTAMECMVAAIAEARRVALHGCGREGLMMKAFAMRLFHLGLDVHVVGDMTTPPLGPGDLLLVSAGPGYVATVAAIVEVARQAGARTACVTAQPAGAVPRACDLTFLLPAQTMADDRGAAATSVLPMGSLFEGAQFLVFELLVLALRERLGETAETMRARHTNLE